MGGESESRQESQTRQQATPWAPAVQPLEGILGRIGGLSTDLTGAETGALNQLATNAQAGNPFAGGITNVANTLLSGGGPDRTGMVSDAYSRYLAATNPTVSGDYLDPNKNPFFASTTSGIADDVMARVRAEYAGSGRDPTGAGSYAGNVGGEVAKALAPTYANLYNTERDRQMAAITGQYGAGGQTAGLLSGLDQTRLGNMQAGINAADAATVAQNYGPTQILQIEAQRRGIPLQTLAAEMGIVLPAAQAFGTQTGTSTQTGTQQMSGADQFLRIAGGLGSLFGRSPTPRAEGGPLDSGQVALVGERGPEIFVPDQPGTVIPNRALTRDDMYAAMFRDPQLKAAFMQEAARPMPVYDRGDAFERDVAGNVFGGTQTMLPNDVRRSLGVELTPMERIEETFLASRGVLPWSVGRGTRFTPMGSR